MLEIYGFLVLFLFLRIILDAEYNLLTFKILSQLFKMYAGYERR